MDSIFLPNGGIYLILDIKQEVYFHTYRNLRCALPHHRHRKLRPATMPVASGTPIREIAEWKGKPKKQNKTKQIKTERHF